MRPAGPLRRLTRLALLAAAAALLPGSAASRAPSGWHR